MPNWCENTVTFKHTDPKQIAKLVRAYNDGRLMSKFFPCPPELADTMSGSFGGDKRAQAELERQERSNKIIFGYANWYDWCCAEWGTKWDVGRRTSTIGAGEDKVKIKRGATEVTLKFDSAWSPPTGFYEKMTDYEGFEICAKYYEPGAGFIGIWQDGIDQSFGFDDCPSGHAGLEWLEKNIPQDLIDTFNLTENETFQEEWA